MEFNETNIDPDVIEFYRSKPKPSSQPQNRSSIPVSQQQHQQQQILYQQQMQMQHNQQILKRQQPQGQMYYQKESVPVQQLTINPQANKQTKVYRSTDYHPSSSTPHSSSGSNTNTGSGTSLKAKDLLTLLKHGIALLPGGRDKRGGPVLCFPANSHADELDIEDLYVLVRYLTFLPDENVKKLKFSVVIDMRAGTTWHSVKPILKVLEECIGQCTSSVYIIKPDKFLEKQKAQMACSKFTFDIQIVSVNVLYQEIDQSQLTAHFHGSLPYSNDEWIEIRICLEDFFTLAHDMSDKFTSLYKFLDRKDIPETVVESKRRVEDHKSVRLKIIQAPVHVLEAEGDKLGHWLRYGLNSQNQTRSSWVTMNPDYQQVMGFQTEQQGSKTMAEFKNTMKVIKNKDGNQEMLINDTKYVVYEGKPEEEQFYISITMLQVKNEKAKFYVKEIMKINSKHKFVLFYESKEKIIEEFRTILAKHMEHNNIKLGYFQSEPVENYNLAELIIGMFEKKDNAK